MCTIKYICYKANNKDPFNTKPFNTKLKNPLLDFEHESLMLMMKKL